MQSSNAPNKISLPFAASGTKNTIPVPSQQGVTPGAASFTDGFPPLTFTPLSAGGVPPAGADFNGILNSITALQQWNSAGGQFLYDATFATAIGGYPKGATVLKADRTGFWISLTENNSTNPDTGGAGWLAFSASAIQSGSYSSAQDTGTANAYAMTLSPAPTKLTPGMMVTLLNAGSTNTASSTLNINGLGALTIVMPGGWQTPPSQIPVGSSATFILNNSASAWILVSSSAAGISNSAIITFTSSTTYTVPPIFSSGSVYPLVTVIGGGGGAGSIYSAGAGGGGGGAGIAKSRINLTGVASVPITVGTGGAGAAAATSGNPTVSGSNGGTSSFGPYLSATGGGGGNNWLGGTSGLGTGGNINSCYGPGQSGFRNDAVASPTYYGGFGGGPGAQASGAGNAAGVNATIPGGGGSGGTPGQAGGNGAPGIVIMEW